MAESMKTPRSQERLAQKAEGGFLGQVFYHFYTIWLFTLNDLRTTCLQTVLFGLAGAASGRLTTPITATVPTPPSSALGAAFNFLGTSLRAFLFVWLLLLFLQLDNQSMPGGPEEDALNNKAWRPIPAGRISQRRVRDVLLPSAFVIAMLVSFILGVPWEAAGFMAVSCIYNQLGGGDVNPVVRNLLNGGLALLNTGSLKLATLYPKYHGAFVDRRGYVWILVVGLIVVTTVQTQDFRDQEGDAARGRRTLPLVIGDGPARLMTAVSMLVWAFLCPWICEAGLVGYVLSVVTAGVASFSLMAYRTRSADGVSFKLWSVWLTVVYAMPWLASFR